MGEQRRPWARRRTARRRPGRPARACACRPARWRVTSPPATPPHDRDGGQRPGTAVQPALAERGAPGQRAALVLLGLDPLGEDGGAGARRRTARTARTTAAASAPNGSCTRRMSSLTTSGRRNGISAIERQSAPTSSSAKPQPRRRRAATARSSSAGRSVRRRSVISAMTVSSPPAPARAPARRARHGIEDVGLDVDEQRRRRVERPERAADRRSAARAVEIGDESLGRRRAEQRAGRLERRADRAAGQRLVGEDAPVGQRDDGLVDGAHAARGEEVGEGRGG